MFEIAVLCLLGSLVWLYLFIGYYEKSASAPTFGRLIIVMGPFAVSATWLMHLALHIA